MLLIPVTARIDDAGAVKEGNRNEITHGAVKDEVLTDGVGRGKHDDITGRTKLSRAARLDVQDGERRTDHGVKALVGTPNHGGTSRYGMKSAAASLTQNCFVVKCKTCHRE